MAEAAIFQDSPGVATNFQLRFVLPTASPPGTSKSNTAEVRSRSHSLQLTQRSCTTTVTVLAPSADVTAIVLPQRLFLLGLPLGVSVAEGQSLIILMHCSRGNWGSIHGSKRLCDSATMWSSLWRAVPHEPRPPLPVS